MKPARSLLLCAPLFLLGFAAHARADARDAGEVWDPAQQGGVSEERTVDPDSDPPTPRVAGAVQSSFQTLTGKERWNLYLRDAFWSPGVFFRAAGPALGAQ